MSDTLLNDPTGLNYRYREAEVDIGWRDYAECKGAPPELFFPSKSEQWNARIVIDRFCSVCPVQEECLAFGRGEDHGIWGGKTGKELRSIRSGRTRKDSFVKHGTVTGYNNHIYKKEDPCAWCTAAHDEDTFRKAQAS